MQIFAREPARVYLAILVSANLAPTFTSEAAAGVNEWSA